MATESACLPVSLSPCLFLLGGIGAGAAFGWLAAKCHLAGWAPVGLVSLGVGVALGFGLSKLSVATGIVGARRLVVGTVIFALVAVFAEHTWLYRDFRRQWVAARANDTQVALFRPAEPWSPTEYLRRELSAGRVALWCLDAALIAAGAMGVVLVQQRHAAKSASQATRPIVPHS